MSGTNLPPLSIGDAASGVPDPKTIRQPRKRRTSDAESEKSAESQAERKRREAAFKDFPKPTEPSRTTRKLTRGE